MLHRHILANGSVLRHRLNGLRRMRGAAQSITTTPRGGGRHVGFGSAKEMPFSYLFGR